VQNVLSKAHPKSDGDADHALTATFRYFVSFRSRAIRCASAI
jgi:hypothetical protein